MAHACCSGLTLKEVILALSMSNLQIFPLGLNGPGTAGPQLMAAARTMRMCEARPRQTDSAQSARHAKDLPSRVCLDCALPPRLADETRAPECDCGQFEEVEDDWWDFGSAGPVAAFCIGIVCLVLACGYWL
jgi:hypothetical protein